jgi:hypothetical protein
MSHFTIDTIRQQLRGRADGDFTVQSIGALPDGVDQAGQRVAARDILRKSCIQQLEHTQNLIPLRPNLVAMLRSALDGLYPVGTAETIYSWHIASGDVHLAGISTARHLIITLPLDDFSNPAAA